MKLVSFDESGNTGPDLFNEDQPVFVLASTDLTIAEAEKVLAHVRTPQASEAKFTNLRKSNAGRTRILRFLEATRNYTGRIRTTYYHKRYMVVTKVVDVLIETLAHRAGIDLYENGANIATANYHFYCMPVFCGKDRARQFLDAFVAMIRQGDQSSINHFYYTAWQVHAASIDKEYGTSIAPILATEPLIHDILEHNGPASIDPAIPSFFEHCAYWGDSTGEYFDVLHDKSKTLFQEKEAVEMFMSKDIPHAEIGYDRRKYGFPLKANGISFGDSKSDPRLQVVDLIAGSSGYWATGLATGNTDDQFCKQLHELGMPLFTANALWPSMEVDPKKMGTIHNGGINAVDYMTEQLSKLRKRT